MKKLSVGVIGLGIGEQHIIGYLKSKYIKSVCIFDKDKQKANQIQKKYPIKKVYQSDLEMICDKEIDIISIASYDDCHFKQIIMSLNHNKHIFCEKPICQNFYELKKISSLLKKNKNLVMTTNTVLRCSPRFKKIKKEFENNIFGKIYFMELDYNYGRLNKITNGWRGKIENYSVVLGGGIHMLDLLLWFKNSYPKKISSFQNNICTKGSDNLIQDFVISLLQFNDGSVAKVSSNFGCIYPHFHRVMIYGKKKTFEQSFTTNAYLSSKGDGKILKETVKEKYPGVNKYDLIDNFISSILTKEKLIINQKQMLSVMQLCLEINKSLKLTNKGK